MVLSNETALLSSRHDDLVGAQCGDARDGCFGAGKKDCASGTHNAIAINLNMAIFTTDIVAKASNDLLQSNASDGVTSIIFHSLFAQDRSFDFLQSDDGGTFLIVKQNSFMYCTILLYLVLYFYGTTSCTPSATRSQSTRTKRALNVLPSDQSTMIIYKCRFTGDELLSDAFKPRPVVDDEGNEVPGLIEIDSQKVNKVRSQ